MTSSSSASVASVPLERGLDTTPLVYSMLQGHPAATLCERFLAGHSGWFTSPLVLFEAKRVLTRIYGVDAATATQKLMQVSSVPVTVIELDAASVGLAFQLADTLGLDLTDAVLLHLTQQSGAGYLATEDQFLAKACQHFGITPLSPLDAAMRQMVAAWETAHLALKGLPRVLHRVHQWLNPSHPQAAQDFWSQTGAGSHLP